MNGIEKLEHKIKEKLATLEQQGIKDRKVAEDLEISPALLSYWKKALKENNHLNFDAMAKLCNYFKI